MVSQSVEQCVGQFGSTFVCSLLILVVVRFAASVDLSRAHVHLLFLKNDAAFVPP